MGVLEGAFEIYAQTKAYALMFVGILVTYRIASALYLGRTYHAYISIIKDIVLLTLALKFFEPTVEFVARIPEMIGAIAENSDKVVVNIYSNYSDLVKKVSVICYGIAKFVFLFLMSAIIVFGAFVMVMGMLLPWYGLIKGYAIALLICALWPVGWYAFNVLAGAMISQVEVLQNVFVLIGSEIVKLIGAWGISALVVIKPLMSTIMPIINGAKAGTAATAGAAGFVGGRLVDPASKVLTGREPYNATKRAVSAAPARAMNSASSVTGFTRAYAAGQAGRAMSGAANYIDPTHTRRDKLRTRKDRAASSIKKAPGINKLTPQIKRDAIGRVIDTRSPMRAHIDRVRGSNPKELVKPPPRVNVPRSQKIQPPKLEIKNDPNKLVQTPRKASDVNWDEVYENSTIEKRESMNASYRRKTKVDSPSYIRIKEKEAKVASEKALQVAMEDLDNDENIL